MNKQKKRKKEKRKKRLKNLKTEKKKITKTAVAPSNSAISETTVEDLKKSIREEIDRLKLLEILSIESLKDSPDFSNLEKQIIQDETKNIVDSIISATDFLMTEQQNILQNAISVRYILEALITTELLIKEEEYKFILSLAFYPAQKARLKALIEELREEIKRLETWTEKEESEYAKMLNSCHQNQDSEKVNEIVRNFHEFELSLVNKFDEEEFNIYSDANSFHQYPLPFAIRAEEIKGAIPQYEKMVSELENQENIIATKLRNEDVIKRLFPNIGHQKTLVFKEIVDKKGNKGGVRSWDKKAEDAGLFSEYKFMYAYTSNISHFASYSITTSNFMSFDEEKMLLKRIRIYLKRIINNLEKFSNINEDNKNYLYSNFYIVDLSNIR